jgi:hypothetical protein
VEFFKSTQKVVAYSAHHCTYHFRSAGDIGRNIRHCSVYIHFILMKHSKRYQELETILVLVMAAGLLYWHYKKPFFLIIAFLTGLTGVFVPVAGKAIHWAWMKLAEGMGFIMNKVILTLIFVIIVIPLGWISGKMGKSSVKLKTGDSSYFKERNHLFTKEDMENPW